VVVMGRVARRFKVFSFRLLRCAQPESRTCGYAVADGTRDRKQDEFSNWNCARRWHLGRQLEAAATSVRRRFWAALRTSRCSPVSGYVGYRDQSAMAVGRLNRSGPYHVLGSTASFNQDPRRGVACLTLLGSDRCDLGNGAAMAGYGSLTSLIRRL
jgi:hypothetical protein